MVISRHTASPSTLGLPSLYVAHFLDAVVGELDLSEKPLADDGFTTTDFDPDQRVPLDRVLSLLQHIDARARPGWHIPAALALETGHHGPVGVAISSAPTIGRSLELLARYEPLRFPFVVLHCEPRPGCWNARILPLVEAEAPWPLLLEIHLLGLAGLLERLLGRQRIQLRLRMPPVYRAWRPALEAQFGTRLSFKSRHYGLALPADLLEQTSVLANRELHSDAVARCEQILARQSDHHPLTVQIRGRLLATAGRFPSLEETARDLCCSSRTLIRRLKQAGTGYRQLVDEARRVLALDLLQRSDLGLDQIAARLGYRDVANFGRACRRWFGHSPGRLRNRSR